jgi:lipoate-protein ligase A
MALDAQMLGELNGHSEAILHYYDWVGNALTYGHFIEPEDYLRPNGLLEWGYEAARRPTGGGIIFHTGDLAFSVLIPINHPSYFANTMASYAVINGAVMRAVEVFMRQRGRPLSLLERSPQPAQAAAERFCMAHPTRYDVMVGGCKVAGAAQRRTRHGVLHQGSICLTTVASACLEAILAHGEVVQRIKETSYPLLGDRACPEEVAEARHALRCLLQNEIKKGVNNHDKT